MMCTSFRSPPRVIAIALACAVAVMCLGGAARASLSRVTIHVTDWGMKSPFGENEAGRDAGHSLGKAELFPEMPRDALNRLRVSMPPDEIIRDMSDAALRAHVRELIGPTLRRHLDAAERGQGPADFQIRLVENVDVLTYFRGPADPKHPSASMNKQDLAARWGAAVYGALADLAPEIEARTSRLEMAVTAGSNGTVLASKSAAEMALLRPWLRQVTLVDGRALVADVIRLAQAIGADKLSIIVNHGDVPARLGSIGSLVGARRVKEMISDVTVLVARLKPTDFWDWLPWINHISPMGRRDSSFLVRQILRDGTETKPIPKTGAELLPFRPGGTPEKYRATARADATRSPPESIAARVGENPPGSCNGVGSTMRCPPPSRGNPPPPPGRCGSGGLSGPCETPAGVPGTGSPVAPLGGISIAPTAIWSGPLPSLVGARIDPANGRLLLLASSEVVPGGVTLADLARAFDLHERGERVAFTLDPADPRNPSGPRLRAIYMPADLSTNAWGTTLLESDLILKQLSFHVLINQSGRIQARETPIVAGFESEAEMIMRGWEATEPFGTSRQKQGAVADKTPGQNRWARAWITADSVVLRRAGATLEFDVRMAVNARRMVPDPKSRSGLADIPTDPNDVESRWAQHATAYFPELTKVVPSFRRLEEITKAIALAKFLGEIRIKVDREKLRSHLTADRMPGVTEIDAVRFTHRKPYEVRTETADAVVTMKGERQLHLFGGVDLTVRPEVRQGSPRLAELDATLNDRLASVRATTGSGRLDDGNRVMTVVLLPWLVRSTAWGSSP